MKLLVVAGARPNFMKVAPIMRVAARRPELDAQLVHTGQHYDYDMSKSFFEELDLPEPHHFLAAGSGSHAEQTGRIMLAFEKVCLQAKPDLVVVVGDVNSTLACSLTAKKLWIPVAHVEAGLRSGDMKMPEEVNRIVTDSISDYLFVTEDSGLSNLKAEGKGEGQVFFVGNIMIDTLLHTIEKVGKDVAGRDKNVPYAALTLHRPSNVDNVEKLTELLTAIAEISNDYPVHFPVHPRTRNRIEEFELTQLIDRPNIHTYPPMGYVDFLKLWSGSAFVITDSGGIQEETTALGIPCFTLRNSTERPATVTVGSNVLVGSSGTALLREYGKFRSGAVKKGQVPELWDGATAKRILDILQETLPKK